MRLQLIDMAAIAPLLILMGGSLVLILIESFVKRSVQVIAFWFTLAALIAALAAEIVGPSSTHDLLTPWLRFDPISHFFTLFFLTIGLATTLLSFSFFQHFKASSGEYYFLLLSSLFGLLLIGNAADFLTLFLGLEILSLSLYVMCCYMKTWTLSYEAGLKYFLLGSMAAAFLLYGIALIYGATGTTHFDTLSFDFGTLTNPPDRILFLSGICLLTLGLAFKAAIVPFHFWAPDVYDGAPTPVTAFMAVGTKAGAFAAFIIIFLIALPGFDPLWNQGMALLAYPTLIYANFAALRQKQLRRFFAYSGIAHAGFLLIPLAAISQHFSQELPGHEMVSGGLSEGVFQAIPFEAIQAMLFYLVVYALATLGSFAVLVFLDTRKEGVLLSDLQGLARKRPWLAIIFSVCLLTLAGIPPTVGFFSKFYILKLAFMEGYYGLVIVALLVSVLALFYYGRIIAVMLGEEKKGKGEEAIKEEKRKEEESWINTWPATLVGICSLVGIIFLSLFPETLFKVLERVW